jgi:calcineurin-like phosphoesterase family protein
MPNIWFVSDLHFFHNNVIKYCDRPFDTVELMNEILINNWNQVVSPEDSIYCLGDFSLAFRPIELYTSRLNGTKYLVPGNHDMCHSYHKRSRKEENRQKWIEKYQDHGWIVLPEKTSINIDGVGTVDLCHHPYSNGEETRHGDKYAKWRPTDNGNWLLHGHCHSPYQKNLDKRMIDVGVDAYYYKPVSIDEIRKLILQNSPGGV